MTWMLDASAALCWLLDEPGAERMDVILADDRATLIHGVNLVEVRYRLQRLDAALAEAALSTLFATGMEVDRDLSDELLTIAARLKATQAPIALGDTFAVAAAIRRGATLVTTDRGELEKVAAVGVCQIEFLR